MTSILELRDVVRVHGSGETAVHALRGVSLGVGPGELVAVMGPSGSGKSTLLNVAGGLDAPTSGSVLVEGTALGGRSRSAGTPPGRGRRGRRNRFTISGMSLLTIVQRLGHRPWFATFSRTCLVPIDRLIARLSRGRIVTAGLLPALMLTTVGRRSGLPRTQPLVCIPDGDGFLLIGSNWGQPHHPAWSANLIAHPEARVVWRGEEFGVRAELATGPERDRLWALALRTWPAYETYQKRAAHRQIRVFRLTRI